MSDLDADTIREELRAVAEQFSRIEELREHRGKLIEDARAAKLTLREIARLLDMTVRGVEKALLVYRQRHSSDVLAS